MVLVGFGLSLNNSIAVFEGLFNKEIGTFNRTPKFNLREHGKHWQKSDYLVPLNPIVLGELGLAFYAFLSISLLVPYLGWDVVPWLLIYVAGFSYISITNIVQNWQINEHRQHRGDQRSPKFLNS